MPVDKCYTKKNKNGGNYTTCVDGKGKQLREKDKPKKKKLVLKEPAKPAPKKKKLVLKEPAKPAPKKKVAAKYLNPSAGMSTTDPYYIPAFGTRRQNTTTAPLQNVSASTSALSASAVGTGNMDIKRMLRAGLKGSKDVKELSNMMRSAPTAPPANYNMLRPEIRKNILQFAGNPKKVIEEKILVDINLRKDIKTRVINSVLEDMNKSLKELNINTSTPIYNADMRRKMKALGKGFAVGGSNSRDIYEILDDVETALGIDEYMRFLPKVEERLEGVVKQRKQRQARERAEAAKIKKQQKAEADAEAAALGDDDKREFDTIKSVRDYLKWDKDFAKKVNEMAKVGLEKDGNRFDNSLVKVKNFLLNELYRVVFSDGSRHSYNEMKALINSDRNKKIIFNPAWGRYKLYNF